MLDSHLRPWLVVSLSARGRQMSLTVLDIGYTVPHHCDQHPVRKISQSIIANCKDDLYLHPKWLHGPGAPLIDCQSVREVDDFVLRAMDDKDRRSYSWNLVDTAIQDILISTWG